MSVLCWTRVKIEGHVNQQLSEIDPLLGLFADEPDLLDRIVDDAMQSRNKGKLRLTEVTGC